MVLRGHLEELTWGGKDNVSRLGQMGNLEDGLLVSFRFISVCYGVSS